MSLPRKGHVHRDGAGGTEPMSERVRPKCQSNPFHGKVDSYYEPFD